MDRLDCLSAFVAVADQGGFAIAARHLRVSPPAVTRAVAALEGRLGVTLFHRTTRSVRLTEDGAAFLPRCRQALSDLRDAEEAAMGPRAEPRGTLAVTAPVLFGRMHVAPVVAELLCRHPLLSVRLVLLDRMVNLVDEGFDVAVRIGALADSALSSIRVGEARRVLVASLAYLEANGTPGSARDLGKHAVIAFTGVSASDTWQVAARGSAAHVRPRLVVNDADAAISAAVAGLGITRVLSYQVSADLAAGRLQTVLDQDAGAAMPVSLLFQSARKGAPNVRAFVELAKTCLQAATLC